MAPIHNPDKDEDDSIQYDHKGSESVDSNDRLKWDDLTEWEQVKYALRILREVSGLTDKRLRHSYEGDGSPFDTGFIDWKRIAEEEAARKLLKKKRGKKNATQQ